MLLQFASINILVFFSTFIFLKKYKGNELFLNAAPILSTAIVCITTAAAHSVYPVTVALLCLPVFMTAVFGIPKLTYFISAVCAIGVSVAVASRAASPYFVRPDTKIIPEAFIAYFIIIIALLIALTMIKLLEKQKIRLIALVREAQTAHHRANDANRAKTEFIANMSHEIRTPLNAVLGMTEMIARRTNEDEIREYAGDIQQAGTALLAIISDILDISKIESGRIEISESNYELGSLINDSYNMVAARWREKGLTATVICDPMLPRMLCGDEYHLRQIIVNLLSNAVKYTNDGGIELNVSGEENGDILRMEVKVKDSGIGIREEDMPLLFGKFTRLDISKNRKIERTGLGLAITKQLVELMNGTINVESVYGVGSTFTVRVPQKIADRTPIGDIHTTYLDVRNDIERYQQSFEAPEAKILVVDDVAINLQVIGKLLEATKIKVDTANSGKECLIKACRERYDIILMDHMMPQMDGLETLKALNAMENSKNSGVPVIMLTANAIQGAREEYIKAGFVDYLSKPVRGARLEKMILNYLPKEKIISTNTEAETREPQKVLTIDNLREILPEIDVKLGISFCADDESFYMSMINEFISNPRDTSLGEKLDAGDIKAYQIEVHSLKSSAKMIGLSALSDECLELENAAKTDDIDFIKANHPNMIKHYQNIIERLRS